MSSPLVVRCEFYYVRALERKPSQESLVLLT